MYIFLAILIFGVLIFVHELGHFLTAKLFGVRVNEFAMCMGPAIFQKTIGETTYSLRCIPIGGYCAMEGEDEDSEDPRAFTSKPAWQRAIILVAGAAMNFLVGLLVVVCMYLPSSGFVTTEIVDFMDGCALYSETGLQPGDRILSVDGERVYTSSDLTMLLERGQDSEYDIVVRRNGKRVKLKDFRMEPQEFAVNGETKQMYGLYFGTVENSLWQTLRYSWNVVMDFGRIVRLGLVDLITGAAGLKDMSGPVGIVAMISETGNAAETTSEGVLDVLYLGAFLAVNLAFMNLLPVPALDGGRVVGLVLTAILEAVTRRKIDSKYEGYVHAVGMVLLLGLSAVLIFKDVFALFR